MSETWRPVVGYDGYEVSDLGRVRSYRKPGRGSSTFRDLPRLMTPVVNRYGYPTLNLCNGTGAKKVVTIHRLVADAFVEGKFEDALVLHGNGVPADNRAENLRWGTARQNKQDQANHRGLGRRLSADDVREIRRLYEMGFTQREIARVFQTTQSYVHELVSAKKRKDVA